MLKYLFILLILAHGLIHLLGLFKAFDLGNITQLTRSIPKPLGMLWLLGTFLFIGVIFSWFFKPNLWPVLAIAAIILSQSLIITAWQDAKYGTIANIIILIVAIPQYGSQLFSGMVEKEAQGLLESIEQQAPLMVDENNIRYLPVIVQTWLKRSGSLNRPEALFVGLRQKGKMKTKPAGKWMDFTAQQYFNVKKTSFVWVTKVQMMPGIYLDGRDKLVDGKGEMLIKLQSLFTVVKEGNNEKMNTGAMIRYLAEMIWFPSAALSDYVVWEEIDANTVKATLTYDGQSVSGVFRFSADGDMLSFSAKRYYGGGEDATLETWVVETEAFTVFNGYRIPSRNKVTWKLPSGDFTWLQLEITDLEVNHLAL
ncbi:MAG: DUF6544 family protein [Saprospiraceae bacterium]